MYIYIYTYMRLPATVYIIINISCHRPIKYVDASVHYACVCIKLSCL